MEKVTMKTLVNRFATGCVAGLVMLPLLFSAGCTPQSYPQDDGPGFGAVLNDGAGTAEDGGGDIVTTTNPDEGTGRVEEDGTTDTVSTNTGEPGGANGFSGELNIIRFTESNAPVRAIAIPAGDSYVFMGSATGAKSRTLVVGQSLPRQEVVDTGIDLFGQMLYLTRDSEGDVKTILQQMERDLGAKPKEVKLGNYTGFRFEEIDEKPDASWSDTRGAYIVIPVQSGYLLAMFSAEATPEVYAILSSIEED